VRGQSESSESNKRSLKSKEEAGFMCAADAAPRGEHAAEDAARSKEESRVCDWRDRQCKSYRLVAKRAETPPVRARGLLFATPLWQSNLLKRSSRTGEEIVNKHLLATIKSEVAAEFRECSKLHETTQPFKLSPTHEPGADQDDSFPNHAFYKRQLSTQQSIEDGEGEVVVCAAFLAQSEAFRELAAIMRQSTLWFLCDCYGMTMVQAKQWIEGRVLFAFAAGHGNKSSHAVHIHHDSVVSGVFYVSVPPGSGACVASLGLILEDNEVIMPTKSMSMQLPEYVMPPAAGDLFVFPGWMPHHVEQSLNMNEPRLSISFNMAGNTLRIVDEFHLSPCFRFHSLDDYRRLNRKLLYLSLLAEIGNVLSPIFKALLHNEAGANNICFCLVANINQGADSLSRGQHIVNDQNLIICQ